jgi:hypothetical protein
MKLLRGTTSVAGNSPFLQLNIMKDLKNQPPNAETMLSGAAGGWKARRPAGRESRILCAAKMEKDNKPEASPAFWKTGSHVPSCLFNRVCGNRRNNGENMRKYTEH